MDPLIEGVWLRRAALAFREIAAPFLSERHMSRRPVPPRSEGTPEPALRLEVELSAVVKLPAVTPVSAQSVMPHTEARV